MDESGFSKDDLPSDVLPTARLLPRRRTPWNTVGGRVISLVSRKGGVGKTTSAVNLGAALALSGHSVLVIGVDAQCGVCRTLGVRPHELPRCLTELWSGRARLADLAQPSPVEGLFFVSPRILTLDEEERFHNDLQMNGTHLVREIDRARSLYDTILLDCPPGLGAPARAALLASDGYLVPVQAEELCRDSLDVLLEFIDEFRDRNFSEHSEADSDASSLHLEGMFLTMAAPGTRVGKQVAARVQEDYGDVLFETAIPRTVRLGEMALKGQPAVIYDRRSNGSRAYFDLADEIVARYCVDQSVGSGSGGPDTGLDDRTDEVPSGAERFASGGLERFLSALSASGVRTLTGEPHRGFATDVVESFNGPEMVSLDELLDEEERRTGPVGDDDDDNWSYETDRLN